MKSWAGVACAALGVALFGCAQNPSPTATAPPSASPAVRGADSGLELRWWILPDDGDVIARALAVYESRPTPVDGAGRAIWRANGLRLIAVPVADIGALQARFQQLRSQVLVSDLRASGIPEESLARVAASMAPGASTSQEQWLGEVPVWTDAIRGPLMGPGTGRGTVIKMDGGPLSLGPGRLRLLLRAWSVPTRLGADRAIAGLRLELAPQFQQARMPGQEPDFEVVAPRSGSSGELRRRDPLAVEEQGLILSRLVLSMTLDGTDALVIVPDRPDVDWGAIAAGDPVAAPATPGMFGPPAPEGITLGEAMLSSEPGSRRPEAGATPMPRRPAKAVIVLVPRVREQFELFGP